MTNRDADDTVLLSHFRRLCSDGTAKSIRLGHDLSLGEAAKGAGHLAKSTIWRWEEGHRRPRGNAALLYAKFLNVLTGGVLFGGGQKGAR